MCKRLDANYKKNMISKGPVSEMRKDYTIPSIFLIKRILHIELLFLRSAVTPLVLATKARGGKCNP